MNNEFNISMLQSQIDACNRQNEKLNESLKYAENAVKDLKNEITNQDNIVDELNENFKLLEKISLGKKVDEEVVIKLEDIKYEIDKTIIPQIKHDINSNNQRITNYNNEITRLKNENN